MNLLIVEDEAYALQGILDGVDWPALAFSEVFTAKSYAQAREILEKQHVHILLSDIELPEKSGLELIDWANNHRPDTVCIILSCHADFEYARRAVGLKCLDYVIKPVAYDQLTEILRSAQAALLNRQQQTALENYGKIYVKTISDQKTGGQDKLSIVETVAQYISDHLAEPLSVEGLARLAYVSPDYLTRAFKKRYGRAVIDYINEQRLLLAGEMLKKKDMSVKSICYAVGFNNFSYFIRQFKRFYGKTPSEFVEQLRQV
ncbi:MAG TPA: hypothetical protein DCM45_03355 [Clostridiales bacterium]|nr:hypothetical protein [Clostridiales bacterium]